MTSKLLHPHTQYITQQQLKQMPKFKKDDNIHLSRDRRRIITHLHMHLWVRVHVVKELLVVHVLLIPLKGLVIPEVISQGDKKNLTAVEFGLFAVLIQKQACSDREKKVSE